MVLTVQFRKLQRAVSAIWLLALLAGGGGAALAQDDTVCDPPHVAGAKSMVMLLWRGPTEVERGFRDYIESRDLEINVTCLSIKRDRSLLPGLIAEARALKPDLVYTWGTSVTMATVGLHDDHDPQQNITDIPVIFTMVSYPVGSGIVPSFESPGRNITGSSHTVPLEAQLRAMQAYRTTTRIGVLFNPLENNSVINVQQLQALSATSGVEIVALPVPLDAAGEPDTSGLPALVAQLAAREPQFLYIGPDSFIGDHRDVVIAEALGHGVPAFTGTELEILDGDAMIGLVTGYYNLGQYMGSLAERILFNGEAPEDIPVRRLSRFTYLLRLEVAKTLGLFPPLKVLDFARILEVRTP
jgi:putative ABC transport system substrate-binding protein